MNEEELKPEEGTYTEGVTFSTSCEEHEWAKDKGDPNSDMESYVCIKCGSGMNKAK